ncbi:hypothetical protein TUM19329_28710 [Legionella antarctica]|uniref:RNA polymerase sigma factor n=1 Tax=Legionella antarctica TaxID=2708020 RepID=A0A6F8T8M8_9GAMM|nr:RNA polymerase sigma factor [Legionella antarctica]BCA96510.1 hypothetical protein TUM19329_28710 [Legionella antarctica]
MDVIIQSALNGDEESFNALIQTYTPSLKATLRSIVNEATAADIIQETWLSVYTHPGDFKQQSHFKTWFYRISINKAKTHFKSAWIQKITPESDSLYEQFENKNSSRKVPELWGMESHESLLDQEELAVFIQANIEHLPQQQRMVFFLHDIEQLSSKDICSRLSLSQLNAFSLLH